MLGNVYISIIEVFYLNEKENSLYFLPLAIQKHTFLLLLVLAGTFKYEFSFFSHGRVHIGKDILEKGHTVNLFCSSLTK